MKNRDRFSPALWKRLWPFMKKLKKELLIVAVFLVVSSVLEASYPLFTRFAVNNFIAAEETGGLAAFVVVFVLVILGQGVAVIFFSRYSMIVEMRLGPAMKRACFTHLQRLSVDYYSKNSVGYLIARVMSDTDRIAGLVSWGLMDFFWGIVYLLGTIIFMLTMSPGLTLLVIPVIPATILIIYFFQRKLVILNRRVREINSKITGAYNESITGAKTAKTLVIEDRFTDEFKDITADMEHQSVRSHVTAGAMVPLVMFLGSVAVGTVLYRGGVLTREQLMDYGVLSAFILYAVGIIEPVQHGARTLTRAISTQPCVERVTALLDEPVTLFDAPEVIRKYGDEVNPKRENWEPVMGDIEFEDVWFRYPGSEQYILRGFNLKIPRGTTIALVGETGAGKSTIVNLACRFYAPERGRILVDGRDVRERSQLWLHSSIGYMLQDPHLFSGTIRENIRYGKLDATDDEVLRAARLVSADTVAGRMRDGFDTQVGEGGGALSTGEKQLVSFARAMIADPPIFILDEATSSIDTETETLIQNAIANVLSGRTSFIIAHRLSTVAKADLIIVIDEGEIVEMGTHSELIKRNGRYFNLYEAMRIQESFQ